MKTTAKENPDYEPIDAYKKFISSLSNNALENLAFCSAIHMNEYAGKYTFAVCRIGYEDERENQDPYDKMYFVASAVDIAGSGCGPILDEWVEAWGNNSISDQQLADAIQAARECLLDDADMDFQLACERMESLKEAERDYWESLQD